MEVRDSNFSSIDLFNGIVNVNECTVAIRDGRKSEAGRLAAWTRWYPHAPYKDGSVATLVREWPRTPGRPLRLWPTPLPRHKAHPGVGLALVDNRENRNTMWTTFCCLVFYTFVFNMLFLSVFFPFVLFFVFFLPFLFSVKIQILYGNYMFDI